MLKSFECSVAIALFLTAANVCLLYYMKEVIININIPGLYYICMANNIYQVLTHVLTSIKFMGGKNIYIPGGAKDNQSIMEFTMHNVLDLLGWLLIFMYMRTMPLIYVLLAGAHMGVGMIAIIQNKIFQEYYIRDIYVEYPSFQKIKIGFVILDFVCRTKALYDVGLHL
jgi:hypothetical protein